MIRTISTITVACALTACGQRDTRGLPPQGARGVDTLGARIEPMDDCDVKNPPMAGEFLVIRVVVPEKFGPDTSPQREVSYGIPEKDSPPTAADDNVLSTMLLGDGNSLFGPQPFNIDLTGIDLGGFAYAKVKIILKQPNYTFTLKPDPESDPVEEANTRKNMYLGFTKREKKKNNTIFCNPDIGKTTNIDAGKTYEFVSFFMKIKKKGTKQKGSFSFRMVPRNYEDTPIYIDPKVHNEG